jgi:hypothetical protein
MTENENAGADPVLDTDAGDVEDDFDSAFDDFAKDTGSESEADAELESAKQKTAEPDTQTTTKTVRTEPVEGQTETLSPQLYYQALDKSYQDGIADLAQKFDDGEITNVEFEIQKAQLQVNYQAERGQIANTITSLTAQQRWLEDSSRHPDWKQTGQSPAFIDWLADQPPGIKAMAGQFNAQNYDWLLSQFKTGQANDVKVQQANSLTQQRQARLKANVAVKGQTGSQPTGVPEDFDGAFDYFASKK